MQNFLRISLPTKPHRDHQRSVEQLEQMFSLTPGMKADEVEADPLTPREMYALRLVADLVGALQSRADEDAPSMSPRKFVFGDMVIDTARREVLAEGHSIRLTPRAYEVLVALAERAGASVSRAELRRNVWRNSISSESRAIDQAILELRRKLERDPRNPRYIRMTPKFGYRLEGKWVEEAA